MLLFNLPKLVLPAIAGISIHLMLLFNCVRYYCIYKSFNISIHLMLLFNVSLSFHCMCNNHFNTSNVTIQLIIIDSTTCTYLHFNTSNVTIQPYNGRPISVVSKAICDTPCFLTSFTSKSNV